MHNGRSARGPVFALAILAVGSVFFSLCMGAVDVPAQTVFRMLLSKLPLLGEKISVSWTETEETIVLLTRLPRVLLGLLVGCSLAFSGACMQTLVRNALADPYVLGVSYGAASFAAIGLATGLFSFLGVYQNAVNGCVGALLSIAFVYFYSLRRGKICIDRLLLGGIALALFEKAVVKIVAVLHPQVFLHSNSAFWTQGGLAGARWAYLGWPALLLIACFAFLGTHHRALNALLCGEDAACSLGIRANRAQKVFLLATSVMVGITVSVSGGIGFAGLIAPHVARLWVGAPHRRMLPVSALLGGIFVLWCDVAARTLLRPEELSVGILTALVGGPAFLFLLRRKEI